MGRKQRTKLLQFVDDLVAKSVQVLTTTLDVPEPQAKAAATEIAHRICSQYARTYMYVPTDLDFELLPRDRAIWNDYGEDGPPDAQGRVARRYSRDRVDELAAQHGITPQQVYNIIRMMKRLELRERQNTLPGFDPQ